MNIALLLFASVSLLHWDGAQHYLLDENNKPVLLMGHYYPGVVGSANTETDYDITLYKNICTANNLNCIRLWDGDAANGVGFRYHPWVRNGAAAPDGGLKFDLTSVDLAGYFQRLTNVVAQMDSINVYCVVMTMNGFCGDITNRFSTNRFYTGMNVNGHVLTTNDWFTMTDTTWVGYMTNYWRVFCDYMQPYKNVLIELGNEMPQRSTNFNYYGAKYIRDYEATLPRQHPIVISAMSSIMPNSDTYQTNLIVSSNVGSVFTPPNNSGAWQNNPPRVTSTYVQIIDTDHTYGNPVGTISNMQQTLTRGYGGYLNLEPTWWHPNTNAPADGCLAALGRIRSFVNYMDLSTAQPSNNFSSSGYAITNTYGQVLAFAQNRSSIVVNHATGWIRYRWFDPNNGTIADAYWIEPTTSDTYGIPSGWPSTTTNALLLVENAMVAAGVEFGVQTNDYIDCGAVTGTTGNLTMSAWIMLNTNSLNTSQLNIMANGGSWLIDDKTRLDFSSAVKDNYGATNALQNLYQWYHVCGTRSNTTYRLYVNGVQSGTNVTDSGSTATSFNFTIGSNGTHNLSFVGWIRDCQVYSRVLSDAEIYALSKTLGPVTTTNLIAWWPLTDFAQGAACDTLVFKDKSGNGWNGTAHKGTGGAMVQRQSGAMLRRF